MALLAIGCIILYFGCSRTNITGLWQVCGKDYASGSGVVWLGDSCGTFWWLGAFGLTCEFAREGLSAVTRYRRGGRFTREHYWGDKRGIFRVAARRRACARLRRARRGEQQRQFSSAQ